MSKSIRFIGVALLFWGGVRAVSLGLVPGTKAFAFDTASAERKPRRLPPILPTTLPQAYPFPQSIAYGSVGGFAPYPVLQPYPVYVPVPAAAPMRSHQPQLIYVNPPEADARSIYLFGSAAPGNPFAQQLAMTSPVPVPQVTPSFGTARLPGKPDRLSLSSWALMRDKPGPDSLANSGMLGGSEAGARLIWRLDPKLAATLRTSAPINSQRGLEAALGLRYQPFADWPIAVTLERRHGFRDYGRSAFALFAEGGVYGRIMPWGTTLDGYLQAGVVDFNNPDWFVDGQAAMTRPVWRNISAGLGMWGGAQPGLRRLDIGPRLSVDFGKGTRAHADYRLNVAGNAQPGSGATITLAGDF